MRTHPEEPLPPRRPLLFLGLGFGLGLPAVFIPAVLPDNEAMAEAVDAPSPEGPPGTRSTEVPLRIHSRRDWKAKEARRPAEVVTRRPDRIVVHHTATANSTNYSLEHAYRLSRAIQRFHMRGQGWDDTGQQLTISRGGHVMEGRNRTLPAILAARHVIGAQALHHNHHTIGIENEGTYTKAAVPDPLWSSLTEICTWLCSVYRLDPHRAIIGHRDVGRTTCPGNVLYARLPELRRTVAARLDRPPKSTRS